MERNKAENASFLLDEEEASSSKLREISFEELSEYLFSPGNLYWKKSSGKELLLSSAGDRINQAFIQKFQKVTENLLIDPVASKVNIDAGVELFNGLKNATQEKLKIEYRDKILLWLKKLYWEKSDASTLDLVIVAQRSFFNIPEDLENMLTAMSEDMFKRTLRVSSLGVVCALLYGFYDFNYLKDFYNIFFIFDLSLTEGKMSYSIGNALSKEFEKAGSGAITLKNTPAEESVYLNHQMDSYKVAQNDLRDLFKNTSVLRLIQRHHERLEGGGFPRNNNWHELSDLERVVCYVSHIIPIENTNYEKEDGSEYLLNLFTANEFETLVDPKLAQMAEKAFVLVQDDTAYFLQKAKSA